MTRMISKQWKYLIGAFIVSCCMANSSLTLAVEATPETTAELETLKQQTPNFFAHIDTNTGKPDFLFGEPLFVNRDYPNFTFMVQKFFEAHPNLFPLPISNFKFGGLERDNNRRLVFVHMFQYYDGRVPTDIELIFVFDRNTDLIGVLGSPALLGTGAAQTTVNTEPTVTADDVKQVVAAAESTEIKTEPHLMILASDNTTDATQIQQLVWRLKARGKVYYVDAHTKEIVHAISPIGQVLDRSIYTANGEYALPGTLLIAEGGDVSTVNVIEAVKAYTYSQYVYDYYHSSFGLDSMDGSGAPLITTVNYGHAIGAFYCIAQKENPLCPNITEVIFQDGYVTLDITGHEWTHGMIAHAIYNPFMPIGLTPLGESGALNESYADIFGVLIEAQHGDGLDWNIGEDASVGILRNLQSPATYNQPERMADACTEDTLSEPNCVHYKSDSEGIHINNGIPNKAAYLLMRESAEGAEVFDQVAVQGIGQTKAQTIFYNTIQYTLINTPTFSDNLHALLTTCFTLDEAGITMQDCQLVYNAYTAVGIADSTLITNTDFVVQPAKVEPDPAV